MLRDDDGHTAVGGDSRDQRFEDRRPTGGTGDRDDAESPPGDFADGLLGAAVRWSGIKAADLPGQFQLLLWGRNLLDEEFGLSGQTELQPLGADETQIFGEPRTYGLTLTYEY